MENLKTFVSTYIEEKRRYELGVDFQERAQSANTDKLFTFSINQLMQLLPLFEKAHPEQKWMRILLDWIAKRKSSDCPQDLPTKYDHILQDDQFQFFTVMIWRIHDAFSFYLEGNMVWCKKCCAETISLTLKMRSTNYWKTNDPESWRISTSQSADEVISEQEYQIIMNFLSSDKYKQYLKDLWFDVYTELEKMTE